MDRWRVSETEKETDMGQIGACAADDLEFLGERIDNSERVDKGPQGLEALGQLGSFVLVLLPVDGRQVQMGRE